MSRRRLRCVLAAVLMACRSPPSPVPAPTRLDLDRLLPDAATLAGWRVVDGPASYSPENLYEVLDGGAERYVGYGFERLLRVRYRPTDEPALGVTLGLFDMGSDLGAFGIYSSGRPPDGAFQRWGVEGYRVGTIAVAWKGRLFVHVAADESRPTLLEMAERLVRGACERAAGAATPPAVLVVLPAEGLVPHSELFVASNLLGHECLPGGVLARYATEEGRGELFFSELASPVAAAQALAELRAHYQRSGATLGPAAAGSGGFSLRDPAVGAGTLIASGRFVAGVHGTLSEGARERLLSELVSRLPHGAGPSALRP
jgi:hypothetical protein